jgi:integrase
VASDYAALNTAPKTYRAYRDIVRLHLTPELGALNLNQLRPDHIQGYYARMRRDKGLSPLTVRKHHQILNSALRYAVRQRRIYRNPADTVERPRVERRVIEVLAPSDVLRLFDQADRTSYGALVWLAVMTGMRQGELLGVRWQDVDLDNGVLRVVQVSQWMPGQGATFRQPKTQKSRRSIDLSPDTVRRLREHRQQQLAERMFLGPAYNDRDLVFATPVGTAIDPANLRRTWLRIRAAAGLPSLRSLGAFTRKSSASVWVTQASGSRWTYTPTWCLVFRLRRPLASMP